MIEEWNLIKILNRVEILPEEKNYKYNRMNSINSKPALQKGSENLKEYRVKLPLHIQFCNPKKIIELIEVKAQTAQPVEWIYNGEYKGLFVIEKIEKDIRQFKDIIIYAELVFNFLEVAQNEEFIEQKTEQVDLSKYEQFEEESFQVREFSKNIKDTIVDNFKTTIITGVLSPNLSDAVKEIASGVAIGSLNDIAQGNVTDIYSNIKNYTDIIANNSSITFDDAKNAAKAIGKIPELILNCSLRSKNNL